MSESTEIAVINEPVYVDRFYEMNPHTEDVIRGDELANGMVVLIEDHMVREDPSRDLEGYVLKRLRENNQWCRVTNFTRRGEIVSFIGVYSDGVKRPRTYNESYYWIVKLSVDGFNA